VGGAVNALELGGCGWVVGGANISLAMAAGSPMTRHNNESRH